MQSTALASVLVIDDRREKLLAVEAILADMPIDLVLANSGRKGLQHLLTREFAVVLLDVNMPIIDGFETAKLIRDRKVTEHVPIIFMTAYSDNAFMERGYSLGAVDYILQPVIPAVLRAKVAVFVDLFRKTEQLRRQAQGQERRAAQLHKLADASVAINAAPSMVRMLQVVTDTARDVIGSHQAVTLLSGDGSPVAKRDVYTSFSDEHASWRLRNFDFERCAGTSVALSRVPTRMTEDEIHAHPDWNILKELDLPPIRGMVAVPLLARNNRNMGLIYLSDKMEGPFSADDEAILVQLAQMAVVAMENILNSEAREANRAKDRFIAVLSHELRTPLNPVLMSLHEMRTNDRIPADVRADLEMIHRNVQLEARLIDDLLDVTRISKNKVKLDLTNVDAHRVLAEALETCRGDIQSKSLRVITEFRAAHHRLHADPVRLQQIFWNLIKNAVKFTPEGGAIYLTTEVRPEAIFQLSVRDTGVGIEPGELAWIFKPFEQGSRSSHPLNGGLGLGLAISQALVEKHGGTITAASDGIDRGATFTVRIPLDTKPSVDRVKGKDSFPRPPHSRLSILLVEDHVDTANVMKRLLSANAYDIHVAHTVTDALRLADQHRMDLVISDIGLPDGSGLELMPRLQARGPIIGIALSGFGMESDISMSKQAGFREHLIKPLDFQALEDCILRISSEIASQ